MTIGDEYDRKARIYPALLTVMPLTVTGVVFGITAAKWWQSIATLAITSGFWFLAAQVGRSPGKRLEPDLWKSWGGSPTTALFRHRDNPNPIRVQRIHDRITGITGLKLPTPGEESADPAGADALYGAATIELIEATRDTARFPLLFKENINYGFRRNMLGLRLWGIGVCVVVAALTLLASITDQPSFLDLDDGLAVTLVFLDLVGAVVWWRCVTSEWVKQPALAYAERLIEATAALAEAG